MTVSLVIQGTTAQISGPPSAIRAANDLLRYRVKGYQWSRAYREGRWDGYRTLLSRDGRFPAGLVSLVYGGLRDYFTCNVQDLRHAPNGISSWKYLGELRFYQQEALDIALTEKRGIFDLATGTGKTEIMMAITAALGLPTIVLVSRRDLALQTLKRFRERLRGPTIGMFGARARGDADIVIAMLQSLRSYLRNDPVEARSFLRKFQVMHSDEAHGLPTHTYLPVVASIPAYYRFGWSATPFKEDEERARLQLIGATGPVVMSISPTEAVNAKAVVQPYCTMIKWQNINPKTSWPTSAFDFDDRAYSYPKLYRRAIVENDTRNEVIAGAARALVEAGYLTLVLIREIEHGICLSQKLGAPFVHGGSPVVERQEVADGLRDGSVPLAIASTIFDQGLDVPSLNALVIAGGGKAQHVVVQRLGRGSRPAPGKSHVEVVDFLDVHSRILWRQAKARLKAYAQAGAKIEIVECAI